MKKIFTLSFILACAVSTYSSAQVRFAPRVGVNFSSVDLSGTGSEYFSTSFNSGFQVGAIADIQLAKQISIQTGLIYTTKGAKYSFSGVDGTQTYKYLQIPVLLSSGIKLGEQLKFVGQLGPYLAYSLGGKNEIGGQSTNLVVGDDKDIKPLDFGFTYGVGIEFANAQLLVSYDMGLLNTNPKPTDGSDIKSNNNTISVTLGYFFGGKK